MGTTLKQIAAENEDIAAAGTYRTADGTDVEIAAALSAAVAGTRSYAADAFAALPGDAGQAAYTAIDVTGEDSIAAARRLLAAGERHVAVLNFASARNPGGGYLNGATAQEEDLCRKSLLYTCLLAAPDYYAAHRAVRDPFYSHRLIYSPGVPVIRDSADRLTAPAALVDVITCAAPNAGIVLRDLPGRADEIAARLTERAGRVLAAASAHGAQALVLGAWGCGVFRNDPHQVAHAFRTHLLGGAFEGRFARVAFAVYDRSAEQRNRRAFEAAFSGPRR
jgi:uncharacterized protein (TIGR02452 family)